MTKIISTVGHFTVVVALLGALPLATPTQSRIATQNGQQQSVAQLLTARILTFTLP